MKSREEYQASIFSKRDALLKKRKNSITKALTGTAAAVILTVSVITVPKLTEKQALSSDITLPSVESTTTVSDTTSATFAYYLTDSEETETTKSLIDAAEDVTKKAEAETPADSMAIQNTENKTTESATETFDAEEGVNCTEKSNNIWSVFDDFIHRTTEPLVAPETGGDDNESTDNADEVSPESAERTQDEIVSAAINYLPDSAKKYADPEKAFVTVTRTSQGEEYYEVRFEINGIRYKVILNHDTLEKIAVESSDVSSQSKVAPPYIPEQ